MVLLHCRECGTEIASDTRKTKCPKCGTLFPFACAVCSKLLNPPIPDYPIERYFTPDHKPLCEDHYQRQCPECQRWFQADENPGYFLCAECSAKRDIAVAPTVMTGGGVDGGDYILARNEDVPVAKPASRAIRRNAETADEEESTDGARRGKAGCGLGMLCLILFVTGGSLGWHWVSGALLAHH